MCIFDRLKGFTACLAKAIPLLVTLASLATAITPNPSPKEAELLATVHRVLDVLAVNVLHNTPPPHDVSAIEDTPEEN